MESKRKRNEQEKNVGAGKHTLGVGEENPPKVGCVRIQQKPHTPLEQQHIDATRARMVVVAPSVEGRDALVQHLV